MQRSNRVRPLKPVKAWVGPKPELPMEILSIFRLNYLDLEDYLLRVYKMNDYSVINATGSQGGITPEYLVDGTLPIVANICQLVDNIRRGRRTRNLGLILNLLCQDGFIPPGKYVIDTEKILSPLERYIEILNSTQDCFDRRCVAIKEANSGNVEFTKQVKILDDKILKHQDKLTSIVSRKPQ